MMIPGFSLLNFSKFLCIFKFVIESTHFFFFNVMGKITLDMS